MKATIPGNLDPGPGGINLRTTFTSQFGRLRSLSLCMGPSEFALPASISIEVSSSRSFCRPASQRSDPGTCIIYVRSEGHDQHATGANQSFICVLKKSSLNIRPTRRVEKYIFREDFFVKSSLRSSFRSASMVIGTISPTTILPLQARHSNSSYSCVDINIKRGAARQMCTRVPAQYQSEFVIWSALPVMRNSSFLIR